MGLALTGVVAYAVSNNTAFVRTLIQNQMLFFVLFIAEIGLVIYLSARIMKMSPAAATLSFAVFLGLTAYDTQRIKRMSDEMSGQVGEVMYLKLSIIGALKLYLDSINLFLFFLRIFGRRN